MTGATICARNGYHILLGTGESKHGVNFLREGQWKCMPERQPALCTAGLHAPRWDIIHDQDRFPALSNTGTHPTLHTG
jgi:hypothetical protein